MTDRFFGGGILTMICCVARRVCSACAGSPRAVVKRLDCVRPKDRLVHGQVGDHGVHAADRGCAVDEERCRCELAALGARQLGHLVVDAERLGRIGEVELPGVGDLMLAEPDDLDDHRAVGRNRLDLVGHGVSHCR